MKCHIVKQDAIDQPKESGNTHQLHKDLLTHDLSVTKWRAGSNVRIIGHRSQQDALSHTHTKNQVHLGQADGKRESVVLDHEVDQHLWNMVVMKQIPREDRWPRKICMGLNLGSVLVMKIMRPFMAMARLIED